MNVFVDVDVMRLGGVFLFVDRQAYLILEEGIEDEEEEE